MLINTCKKAIRVKKKSLEGYQLWITNTLWIRRVLLLDMCRCRTMTHNYTELCDFLKLLLVLGLCSCLMSVFVSMLHRILIPIATCVIGQIYLIYPFSKWCSTYISGYKKAWRPDLKNYKHTWKITRNIHKHVPRVNTKLNCLWQLDIVA
jgi:hypothetical protein